MTTQTQADYAATILRLSLGIMFIAHALLKIIVFTPAGTAQFFTSVGLPADFATLTIGVELVGGLMLVLGLYTRWVSISLIPILAGTIVFVHGGSGWLFSNPNGGWEYPAFLISASVAQALLGNGAYALRIKSSPASRIATV